MIIGIVGGVASGKSFVAKKLAALTQGLVINADEIAKQKLTDASVIAALKLKFGSDVFGAEGQVDRKAVVKLVFGSSPKHEENRQWLNALIHPLVRSEISDLIAAEQAKSPDVWIVLDIPLLTESGWDKVCDRVFFIDTSTDLRETYAAERGWALGELAAREQSQTSVRQKKERATDILVNSGVESDLQTVLTQWLSNL